MSRGSLIVADAIAVFVAWYKLGAHRVSEVTGPSFSRILLRDGEILCIIRVEVLKRLCRVDILLVRQIEKYLVLHWQLLTPLGSILFTLNCLHLTLTLLSVRGPPL